MRRMILLALLVPALAHAQARTISIRVDEIAGGRAYLSPGAKAGLAAGASVVIAGKSYRVIDATAEHAAIDVGGDAIAIGATGTASVEPAGTAHAIEKLAAPRPASAWNAQWRDPVHPADTQEVKPVALGRGVQHGRSRVVVTAGGMLFVPREAPVVAAATAGARATYEPYADKPLAIDADASAQVFATHGGDDAARPYAIVREARVRWGDYADPRFAAGRLRWASSSLGLLDGARVAHAFGGVELAAFGGVLPDPLNGAPSLDASRFGAELIVDRPGARASVTAHGSTWQGAIDERRIDAIADAARGPWSIAGSAELSSFAAGNPWGAPPLEVTSASGAAAWHDEHTRLAIDLTYRRPERSLRLAAFLPPEWLAGGPRTQATASAAYTDAWGSIDAGATAIGVHEGVAYGDLRVRLGGARLELGASGGRASFLDWIGGRVAIGTALRRTDATIYYRPELLGYTGATATWIEHRAGIDLAFAPRAEVSYGIAVEGQAGNDLDAITAIATVVWRPR